MRLLLMPLAWLYGFIVLVRNKAFDWGVLKEESFGIPVIVVGNLSVGGTGKSPTVLHLARILKDKYRIAILSRGYGRSTRGFVSVTVATPWRDCGDEPLQYAVQLNGVAVAVCESRREGIRRLLALDPTINLVLLDDAYQHRYVRPDCRILLTTYDKPWFNDRLLPAGRLREPASSASRADVVVVTKCPENLEKGGQIAFGKKLGLRPVQELFFSYLRYGETLSGLYRGDCAVRDLREKRIILFCGIADPSSLLNWITKRAFHVELKSFPDHHAYSVSDLLQVKRSYERFAQQGPACLITTRKDAMRLQEREARTHLEPLPVWVVDIETEFVPIGQRTFDQAIASRVRNHP